MRVDKDEATEFIDAKIAQFKKLETALDEGTFSLETYEAVYKETKIIISRLFSEKEWAKFETEAGLGPEPYIKQFFSDSRRATARFMEQVKQSHISPMLDMTIDQAQQTPEFEWAGLVLPIGLGAIFFHDLAQPAYFKLRYRKHPETAAEKIEEWRRRLVKEHLQKCVSKLEFYKEYLPLTRQTVFGEFSVEELISIKTGTIQAEDHSSIVIGKGNKASNGMQSNYQTKGKAMEKKEEHSVDITTGDVMATQSSIIAMGVENTAMVSVLAASGQPELAQALKVLADAVMTSQDLPADKKEEQVKVINQIGKEAAEPKPNKTMLKILVDGLLATLKVVPDVAGAVTAVMPILSQLHL